MIVVDASVIIELLLRSRAAASIEARLFEPPEALHAPQLLDVEVAQVLRRFAARGVVTAARGAQCLRLLDSFPLRRHAHQPLLSRIWALRGNLTAYDAAYVALAEALGATLLTTDARLAAAPGVRARVEVFAGR